MAPRSSESKELERLAHRTKLLVVPFTGIIVEDVIARDPFGSAGGFQF
jgi:hypothetical protein